MRLLPASMRRLRTLLRQPARHCFEHQTVPAEVTRLALWTSRLASSRLAVCLTSLWPSLPVLPPANKVWGQVSKLQQQVAAVLTEMKLAARPEVVEPASGYKIDMMLLDLERRSTAIQPHSHLSDPDKRASPAGWLVEIDGPSHFLSSPPHRPRGSTLLKRRHLQVPSIALSLSLSLSLSLWTLEDSTSVEWV